MKKLLFVLAILMTLSIGSDGHNPHRRGHWTVSYQNFYDELMPYGEWIYSHDYGYVWRPYVGYDENFRPYATRGHWVYTHLGWTWVSDYRWGWATFHYGRWYYDDYYGWAWIPGDEWAPAWVTWGSYNDCWAWAPMGPGMYAGITLSFPIPSFWWTAVPRQHFCSPDWHRHTYNRPVHVTNITYITNIYRDNSPDRNGRSTWHHGPRVSEVERHSGRHVTAMEIARTERPGNTVVKNNRVDIYRPDFRRERENTTTRTNNNPENRTSDPSVINRERTSTYTRPQPRTNSETVRPAPPVRKEVREPDRKPERPPVQPGNRVITSEKKTSTTHANGTPGVRNGQVKQSETRKVPMERQQERKPAESSSERKRESAGNR